MAKGKKPTALPKTTGKKGKSDDDEIVVPTTEPKRQQGKGKPVSGTTAATVRDLHDDKTQLIEKWLTKEGVEIFDEATAADMEGADTAPVVCVKNVPFTTVWGKEKQTHFMLRVGERKIRIDYHAQHTSGTVEEKIPFWLENALHVPEEVILILDGDGFSKEAKEYAIKRGEATTSKLMRVFADVKSALDFLSIVLKGDSVLKIVPLPIPEESPEVPEESEPAKPEYPEGF